MILMITKGEKSSFSKMMFDTGRLERIEVAISRVDSRCIVNKTSFNCSFRSFDKSKRLDIGR